nr:g-type lectin s-receptor-like serine/threonine-protein kinase [Quercus suber]
MVYNDGSGRNSIFGNPIAQGSGVLTLDSAGTLKITRKGEDPIILYFSTQPTMNTIATLLDSGQTWSLTCWLADQIIAPGLFTLEWDPKGREVIIRRRGLIYWTSGKKFQNMLLDKTKSTYNFTVATNGDEEYFTYNNTDQSQQSKWMISQIGELHDIKGSSIARADLCYGYNTNGGCQRWKQPECRHRGDTFELQSGFFNTEASSFLNNQSLSISDCRHACRSNCSCVAFFSSLFDDGTGCKFWTEKLSFIPGESGKVFFLSPNHSRRGKLTSSLC